MGTNNPHYIINDLNKTIMERQVGKYTIRYIQEEINIENYFRYDVTIKVDSSYPVRLFGHELFYEQAMNLRYSNSESKITETLKEIIRNRKDTIVELQDMIAEN